ncbi:hypothetical protein [Metaclostridioides mangenotii]|uniref:Uncharacterized protein n=1 Tax=Metaclostridioides mangenotii TaxID=1540 RepID=A0ABS4E8H0_9FIRM|nr:hypothetical protein [Clostridioides mangenotii]MBP1854222.1 hypothetical protein [Clostridioides mangenotii]
MLKYLQKPPIYTQTGIKFCTQYVGVRGHYYIIERFLNISI